MVYETQNDACDAPDITDNVIYEGMAQPMQVQYDCSYLR